jgi:hypothetical protein
MDVSVMLKQGRSLTGACECDAGTGRSAEVIMKQRPHY